MAKWARKTAEDARFAEAVCIESGDAGDAIRSARSIPGKRR